MAHRVAFTTIFAILAILASVELGSASEPSAPSMPASANTNMDASHKIPTDVVPEDQGENHPDRDNLVQEQEAAGFTFSDSFRLSIAHARIKQLEKKVAELELASQQADNPEAAGSTYSAACTNGILIRDMRDPRKVEEIENASKRAEEELEIASKRASDCWSVLKRIRAQNRRG